MHGRLASTRTRDSPIEPQNFSKTKNPYSDTNLVLMLVPLQPVEKDFRGIGISLRRYSREITYIL